jgi:putative transposase
MIARWRSDYGELSADRCCRACGIARSTLYLKAPEPVDAGLVEQIEALLVQFPRYGYRRVAASFGVSVKRARTVMRRHQLSRNCKRRKKISTIPSRFQGGANLVRGLVPSRAGEVLAADVTAFALAGSRWGYLAVVLDTFTRQVVGWSVSRTNDTSLTRESLLMALGRVSPGWIHHSDRGANYTSHALPGPRLWPWGHSQLLGSCSSDPECQSGVVLQDLQARRRRTRYLCRSR